MISSEADDLRGRPRQPACPRALDLFGDASLEHRGGPCLDPPIELLARYLEAEYLRRMAVAPAPQRVLDGRQRRPGFAQLERPHDPLAVVRMDAAGGCRIAIREQGMRRFRPFVFVEALPLLTRSLRGRRRQLEVGESGAEVEARPADDDGHQPPRQGAVDRRVGERLVLGDRCLVIEIPDRDQLGRLGAAVPSGRVPRDTPASSLPRSRPPGMRSRIAAATAVFPDAVGPNSASTLTGGASREPRRGRRHRRPAARRYSSAPAVPVIQRLENACHGRRGDGGEELTGLSLAVRREPRRSSAATRGAQLGSLCA